ncbi:MAG: phosphoribosylaminoimidazolesuccinocarboxamide synthase [Methanobacterium sp.]|nr:phosphoribosylaminoimidazolesuccinocarboxamide synthase [Methanobacterium sp.]
MNPKIGDLIYAGKAKDVYETDTPNHVIVKFRDDITAGDGIKCESLVKKGYYNSVISSKFFEILEESGIKTQYIELIKPGYMLCKKLRMIPLEVITRNIATGSIVKKFPFHHNQILNPPIIQMDYKNDVYHDPMLNDSITTALSLATQQELNNIRKITFKINNILKDFLLEKNILFPDFKIEYGFDSHGNIVLGDEISPDTCRFWDLKSWEVLDKDLFRNGESNVMDAYMKIASLILNNEDKEKWNISHILK